MPLSGLLKAGPLEWRVRQAACGRMEPKREGLPMCHDATRWLSAQPRRRVIESFGGSRMRTTKGKPPASGRAAQAKLKPSNLKTPQALRYRALRRGRSKAREALVANHRRALAASGRTAHGKGCVALVRNTHSWLASPVLRQADELRLTFELSGPEQRDGNWLRMK